MHGEHPDTVLIILPLAACQQGQYDFRARKKHCNLVGNQLMSPSCYARPRLLRKLRNFGIVRGLVHGPSGSASSYKPFTQLQEFGTPRPKSDTHYGIRFLLTTREVAGGHYRDAQDQVVHLTEVCRHSQLLRNCTAKTTINCVNRRAPTCVVLGTV